MSRSLRPEDRDAIDLLLDGSRSAVGFAPAAGADPSRLNAAHALLHLLDHFPADEPAADLMARTLDRVGAADDGAIALPPQLRAALGGQQAHA